MNVDDVITAIVRAKNEGLISAAKAKEMTSEALERAVTKVGRA